MDPWRRAALEYLQKSFEADVKGITRYRGLYQLGALGVYYGNDAPAAKAFDVLRKTVGADLDKDLKRYLGRLKLLWENREFNRKDSPKEAPKPEEPEAEPKESPKEEAKKDAKKDAK